MILTYSRVISNLLQHKMTERHRHRPAIFVLNPPNNRLTGCSTEGTDRAESCGVIKVQSSYFTRHLDKGNVTLFTSSSQKVQHCDFSPVI